MAAIQTLEPMTSTPSPFPATPAATGAPASPTSTGAPTYCCEQWNGALNTEYFGWSAVGVRAYTIDAGVTGFTDGPNNNYIKHVGTVLLDPPRALVPGVCTYAGGWHHSGYENFLPGTGHATWYHILHWADIGVDVPFPYGACVHSTHTAEAALRFARSGYWDCYNDYSSAVPNYACGTIRTQHGPY